MMNRLLILSEAKKAHLEILEYPKKFDKTGSLNADFKFKCTLCHKTFIRGGYYVYHYRYHC